MGQSKRSHVLSVGQCLADHRSIAGLIESHFNAIVHPASSVQSALESLRRDSYDLVLVNRIFDDTLEEGTDLIEQMKADSDLEMIPVALVSNFQDAQDAAMALGAVRGFGKDQLQNNATLTLLSQYLK